MQKIIIVGAASGMGKSLALFYSKKNIVAVADKNITALQYIFSDKIVSDLICEIDIYEIENARKLFFELVNKMGGLDILIYSAGIADRSGNWENELQQHNVNAIGFAAIANAAFQYFKLNKFEGQIVGFSSVLAYRGLSQAQTYCAGKAFVHNYLQGLRHTSKAEKLNIHITEICPGFVQTPMIENQTNTFWVTPIYKATQQITKAINNKKKRVFISKRWELIKIIIQFMPDCILHNSFLNRLIYRKKEMVSVRSKILIDKCQLL